MSVSKNDSTDENDSSESETEIREQASFTDWEVQVGVNAQNVRPCQMASNVSAARRWRVLASVSLRMKVINASMTTNVMKI